MECFIDIDLRPDPEFAAPLLLDALCGKLHAALAPNNNLGVALCFPGYQTRPASLGTRIKLLGSRSALQSLTSFAWLGSMRDQVEVRELASVPVAAAHRTLRRVQAKSSPERLRRRLMTRHNLSEAQARERIPDSAAETLQLPFLRMRSSSTQQTFRVFLSLGPEQSFPVRGKFNAYGLSRDATVPWF